MWVIDELVKDLAEYLGESEQEIQRRLSSDWYSRLGPAGDYAQWLRKSPYYLYDLAQWHIAERSNFLSLLEGLPRGTGKLLDFGSGIGSRGLIYSLKGWEVTLCEVNEPCRLFAAYRFLKHNLNLYGAVATLSHSDYFDKVLLIDVVGHLEEPEKTLREVTASMKRGATLEVTWDLFEPPNPTHLWFSDRKEEFKRVLRSNGLEARSETIWTKK